MKNLNKKIPHLLQDGGNRVKLRLFRLSLVPTFSQSSFSTLLGLSYTFSLLGLQQLRKLLLSLRTPELLDREYKRLLGLDRFSLFSFSHQVDRKFQDFFSILPQVAFPHYLFQPIDRSKLRILASSQFKEFIYHSANLFLLNWGKHIRYSFLRQYLKVQVLLLFVGSKVGFRAVVQSNHSISIVSWVLFLNVYALKLKNLSVKEAKKTLSRAFFGFTARSKNTRIKISYQINLIVFGLVIFNPKIKLYQTITILEPDMRDKFFGGKGL